MERYVSQLEQKLEIVLKAAKFESNIVKRHQRMVELVRDSIHELKGYVNEHPFPGMAEEIHYFRDLAPKLYSQLFYYMKLYQVESMRNYSDSERFKAILIDELKKIKRFFKQHDSICQYYYQQTGHWDQQLFTRQGRVNWPTEDLSFVLEPDFCMGSYWVSWIKANERYRDWLQRNLALLQIESMPADSGLQLKWEGGETNLVELAKGLHLSKAFGKASFKDIVEFLMGSFDIEVKRYYTVLQEIGRRKKSRTKYLDEMREMMNDKMDEDL